MTWPRGVFVLILTLGALGLALPAADAGAQGPGPVAMPDEWDPEILDTLAKLPIQDGGRIKPLNTYARFALLRINGSLRFENPMAGSPSFMDRIRGRSNRMEPIEWLAACLFYPEAARHFPHFVVPDSSILDAIGVARDDRGRRGHYSYHELREGRERLFNLAQQIQEKPQEQWSGIERQIMHLTSNVHTFEMITHFFDFARMDYSIDGSGGLRMIYDETDNNYADVLARLPLVAELFNMLEDEGDTVDEERREAESNAVLALMQDLDIASRNSAGLAILPPAGILADHREWLTPADMSILVLQAPEPVEEQLELLAALEPLPGLLGDNEAFKAQLQEFHEKAAAVAGERGEYEKVPSEVGYYNANLLGWSLSLYVLSFIVVAILWFWPMNRPLNVGAFVAVAVPTILLAAAITWRCLIRGRPPVTTLYETILFITAVAVAVVLVTEYINKQKIAISCGAFLGALGMFLANRYEAREGVDTMPNLMAVLDTNFWLATHVVVVTIGYAAHLVAAAIAHVYIFGKLFGYKSGDKPFYRSMTRMVYGAICFGLVFAVAGTVLGGIWANDSWGRFWGWDPKENGALMIVLWSLFMLHARMGGYLRDFGLNIAAIVSGMTVAFAWWGVNLMGVGLHSYGFTSGVFGALLTYYVIQIFVIMCGGVAWLKDQGFVSFTAARNAPANVETSANPGK